MAIRKNKRNPQQVMIEFKFTYPQMKGQFGLEVQSHDYDGLIFNLMDCAKSQKPELTSNESSEEEEEEMES